MSARCLRALSPCATPRERAPRVHRAEPLPDEPLRVDSENRVLRLVLVVVNRVVDALRQDAVEEVAAQVRTAAAAAVVIVAVVAVGVALGLPLVVSVPAASQRSLLRLEHRVREQLQNLRRRRDGGVPVGARRACLGAGADGALASLARLDHQLAPHSHGVQRGVAAREQGGERRRRELDVEGALHIRLVRAPRPEHELQRVSRRSHPVLPSLRCAAGRYGHLRE